MDNTVTFADRLWWARNVGYPKRHKGYVMGATRLARAAKCTQSLISSLERLGAQGSKYNNGLAKALEVDPNWLAYGTGTVPEGFNGTEARKGRLTMPNKTSEGIIRTGNRMEGRGTSPAELQDALVSDFTHFTRIVGGDHAKSVLELMTHVIKVVALESAKRDDKRGVTE